MPATMQEQPIILGVPIVSSAPMNMHISTGNLYQCIPAELPQELVQVLAQSKHVRIERIVSKGHHSAPGFWYDQEQHEWVMLLDGWATIGFADGRESLRMAPGDYVTIPAHVRHRVEATSEHAATVWLAVFYG